MNPPAEPSAAPEAAKPPVAGRREWWIGLVGSCVLRLLTLTLRFKVNDPERLRQLAAGDAFIFVFWHNRLLLVPAAWNRFFGSLQRKGVALTSTSRDGEIIAQFLTRFGIRPIRGSGTRRGATSIRELAGWLKRGHDVGITPDGSRGPRYEIKPGLVLLAQLTGKAVLPISFEFSRAWRLRGWDRFFIPKPFSRVTFVLGELHRVERTKTPEAFEAARQRCEAALMATVVER